MSALAEFSEWKRHPITKVVLDEFQRRYTQLREQLVDQADTVDHVSLSKMAGAAQAYRDMLQITVEELNEESHGN